MFGNKVTGIPGRGINLGSILNGLSRGLSVANRAIPLYQEAKPMFKYAKNAFVTVKTFMNSDNKEKVNKVNNNSKEKTSNIKNTVNDTNGNGPKFFI